MQRCLSLCTMLYGILRPTAAFPASWRNPRLSFSVWSSLASKTPDSAQKIPRKFVSFPFEYHKEVTVRIDSLNNMGWGIGRLSLEQQEKTWVIMVPNVIPGELVRVRIFRNHKNYSQADLIDLVEPSPDRVAPLCPLSETCGGCQYQHMTIESQRRWKAEHVRHVFAQHDLHPEIKPTLGTSQIYHYRSKITPHYDAPKRIAEHSYEIGPIGFQEKTSRRRVDIPNCPIATNAINEVLTQVRETRRQEALAGHLKRPKKGATLLFREGEEGVVTDPNVYITSKVHNLQFRYLAGNFFQNNLHVVPIMATKVIEAATSPTMTHLIDCYCGSGLFSLSASHVLDVCVGIEVNAQAVKEARENAVLNGVNNTHFVSASAEAIFESPTPVVMPSGDKLLVNEFPREATVVVVDPPRKGCSDEFLEQLYKFGPQRIVYMSCDPATQARDAKGIVQAGYSISSVQPFDLFPQTRHIECLVVFEKAKSVAGDQE